LLQGDEPRGVIGVRDQEQETREELLRYLEQVSGHSLRTRRDVDQFLDFLDEVHPRHDRAPVSPGWLSAKRVVLVALMAFAVFQYFAVDVVTEVMMIDRVKFLTPPPLPQAAKT
jgi:hypothetical protein